MINFSEKLLHLLPNINYVRSLYPPPRNDEIIIFSECYQFWTNNKNTKTTTLQSFNRATFLANTYKDKLYEQINTGHWENVDPNYRKAFTLITFLIVLFKLNRPQAEIELAIVTECLYDLDYGLLMGCPLDKGYAKILTETISVLEETFKQNSNECKRQKFSEAKRMANENEVDIPILPNPSIEEFQQNFFIKRQPALLCNTMDHWPALTKWRQPNYLIQLAGERVVPIEIGKHYTNDEWSQDLVRFKEFIERQISNHEHCERIEYLAQHNLFDQIPALRNDIIVPEYCCITDEDVATASNSTTTTPLPDIKAWLGPKDTVSPMHYDPKHNLLAQVFGFKKIILAAPEDSVNLYPHDGDMLKNTAQIDAEQLDFDRFPLVANVKFYQFTLYAGEMLYIPPKWWHHIRSMDKSFSVSFWWE